jgi:hypothetical protein
LPNASDIDHCATLDATLISSPTGTYGSLTAFNTDTGAYTYTLNNGTNAWRGWCSPLPRRDRQRQLQLHGGRSVRATNTSTLTITITGTNDAPVDGDETNNVQRDINDSNGNVLANGVDIDHGATLDVTLISSPTGTYGSLTSFNTETGAYTYTLNAGFNLHKARRSPTVQLHGGR